MYCHLLHKCCSPNTTRPSNWTSTRKATKYLPQLPAAQVCLLLVLLVICNSISVTLGECNQTSCSLPDCLCPGHVIPGDLDVADTPQMVFIIWEGYADVQFYNTFSKLFPRKQRLKNPNGCPISSTVFLSSERSDYCLVNKLWVEGHEIANQGLSKHNQEWWRTATIDRWSSQMLGLEANVVKKADLAKDEISGWRSPFMQPGGDVQFKTLHELLMQYDSTLLVGNTDLNSPQFWPFTLDFPLTLSCNVWPCPTSNYPGLWEVPVLKLAGKDGTACSSLQTCAPKDGTDTLNILVKNFQRHYDQNRAPFMVNLNAPWLARNEDILKGLRTFLEKINEEQDVWILPVQAGLEWIRTPVSTEKLDDFSPWKCESRAYMKCKMPANIETGDEEVNKTSKKTENAAVTVLNIDGNNLLIWQYVILILALIVVIRYDKSTANHK